MGESEYRDGAWFHRQEDGTELRWSEARGRWEALPAGPEGIPAAPVQQEPWLPTGGRARAVRIMLFVFAGLCAVAVVSDAFEYELLGRIADGDRPSDSEINFNDIRQGVIGLSQTALYLTITVVFIMWFHRAYSNLPRLGVRTLRFGPGWAIGAWFVPFLNLVRPKAIANDIWKGSDPDLPPQAGRAWQDGPISGALLGWWWFFWLISSFAGNASFRTSLEAETAAELQVSRARRQEAQRPPGGAGRPPTARGSGAPAVIRRSARWRPRRNGRRPCRSAS